MVGFLISKDLMFSSQILSAAAASRIPLRQVPDAASIRGLFGEPEPNAAATRAEASADGATGYFVIIDLGSPGMEVTNEMRCLQGFDPAPDRVAAFGPHVHAGKLAAATAAGCDPVLSRGQLNRELSHLLAHLARRKE